MTRARYILATLALLLACVPLLAGATSAHADEGPPPCKLPFIVHYTYTNTTRHAETILFDSQNLHPLFFTVAPGATDEVGAPQTRTVVLTEYVLSGARVLIYRGTGYRDEVCGGDVEATMQRVGSI